MRCQRNPERLGLPVGVGLGAFGCWRGAQQRPRPVLAVLCVMGLAAAAVMPSRHLAWRPSWSQLCILQIWFSAGAEDLVLLFFFKPPLPNLARVIVVISN